MVKNRTTSKNTSPRRNGVANGKTLKKTLGKPKQVTDARQKIIQKKRTHVVDARDVLASMAKTQDVRAKLQKLRGLSGPKSPANVRQIGKHILQRTDKNGKIMLTTNKHKPAANMSMKIREQLGGALKPSQLQQRGKKLPPPSAGKRKEQSGPLQLRRTIDNDYVSPMMARDVGGYYPHPHAHTMYTAQPAYHALPPMMHAMEMRRPAVMDMGARGGGSGAVIVNDGSSGTWKTYASPMRSNGSGAFMEVDSDEDMRRSPRASGSRTGAASVHSRLDGTPASSHGILAQPKAKVVVPVGHRIVVSNLQSTVTQDDIRELFEDIGQLLVARLVRPGTAEVIYKNLKDAQKAVDTYHNRQLDGQPMKCLLVNKRPLNNPTGPAIKSNDVIRKQMPSKKVEKLVPDLSTIHKVLFQRH